MTTAFVRTRPALHEDEDEVGCYEDKAEFWPRRLNIPAFNTGCLFFCEFVIRGTIVAPNSEYFNVMQQRKRTFSP